MLNGSIGNMCAALLLRLIASIAMPSTNSFAVQCQWHFEHHEIKSCFQFNELFLGMIRTPIQHHLCCDGKDDRL